MSSKFLFNDAHVSLDTEPFHFLLEALMNCVRVCDIPAMCYNVMAFYFMIRCRVNKYMLNTCINKYNRVAISLEFVIIPISFVDCSKESLVLLNLVTNFILG